ncbi:MAG: OmpA family protein [Cytophagaceae bacterium]|nr:OmpA family protein [Cytophagaceae bacterium]
MVRIFFSFSIFFLAPLFLSAQSALISMGDKEYSKLRYSNAIQLYEEALRYDSSNMQVGKKLAISYHKILDSRNAERVFKKFMPELQNDTVAVLGLAESLAENGKYEESEQWYKRYAGLHQKDPRGKMYSDAYQNLNSFYKDSSEFKIYFLDINSNQSDFSPSFYNKGIVFPSSRQKEHGVRRVFSWNNTPFLELYYSDTAKIMERLFRTDYGRDDYTKSLYSHSMADQKLHSDETKLSSNDSRTMGYYGHSFINDSLNQASNALIVTRFNKKINTKYHEGPLCFTQQEDTVFFTRNNFYKGRYRKSNDGVNKLKIFQAVKSGDTWINEVQFPYNHKEYSIGHPSFDYATRRLYFSSDMPGGYGGTDLYYSELRHGKWEAPINLGNTINTPGNEMFPFTDQHGNLFFASNGHGGLGGLDIYKATAGRAPVNMGFPVNSRKDDFGYIENSQGSVGYFSSNRKHGGYDDDIYMFFRLPSSLLYLHAYDKSPGDTLANARLEVFELGEDTLALNTNRYSKYQTFTLRPGKRYLLKATGNDTTTSAVLEVTGTSKLEWHEALPLLPKPKSDSAVAVNKEIEKNCSELRSKYSIANVYYDLDKFDLRNQDEGKLVHLCSLLKANPDLEVLISSHTDSRQNFNYNQLLSEKRSQTCAKYLEKSGIPAQQIQLQSFSESKPVNACLDNVPCLEAMHQLNRRSEFVILKNKVDLLKDCRVASKPLQIRNIYFDLNKDNITAESAMTLDSLVAILKENPTVKLAISSYTDSRASSSYNQELSKRRMRNSVMYLTAHGIPLSQIASQQYFGETRLVNDCNDERDCLESQHKSNRRTEFVIVQE